MFIDVYRGARVFIRDGMFTPSTIASREDFNNLLARRVEVSLELHLYSVKSTRCTVGNRTSRSAACNRILLL